MKNQLIILGGGDSINEGLQKDLKKRIKNKFVLGCNYAYRFFENLTATTYIDKDFYLDEKDNLRSLPLVIGEYHSLEFLNNTIPLRAGVHYTRDLRDGVFKDSLTGIFTLSLGIYLLNVGTIFLLGYDFGAALKDNNLKTQNRIKHIRNIKRDENKKAITHFYQDKFKHSGTGKTQYYCGVRQAHNDFKVYINETKVKIYNVSTISRIPTFEKITYNKFFKILDKKRYNQDELRNDIHNKLRRFF